MSNENREEIKQIVKELLEEYHKNGTVSSQSYSPIVCSCSMQYEYLPDYLTEEQVLELTGWSKKTLYNKRSHKEVPYCRKVNRYPKKELFEYVLGDIQHPNSYRKNDVSQHVNLRLNKSKERLVRTEKAR